MAMRSVRCDIIPSVEVVTATVEDTILTLTPVVYGAATVTITATDSGGLSATHTVAVGVSDRLVRAVLGDTLAAQARAHLASVRTTLRRRLPVEDVKQSYLKLLGKRVARAGDLEEVA